MNLNTLSVVLFVAGSVLMYAGVNNKDPRDVVLEALGRKTKFGPLNSKTAPISPTQKMEPAPASATVPPGVRWTNV